MDMLGAPTNAAKLVLEIQTISGVQLKKGESIVIRVS